MRSGNRFEFVAACWLHLEFDIVQSPASISQLTNNKETIKIFTFFISMIVDFSKTNTIAHFEQNDLDKKKEGVTAIIKNVKNKNFPKTQAFGKLPKCLGI